MFLWEQIFEDYFNLFNDFSKNISQQLKLHMYCK